MAKADLCFRPSYKNTIYWFMQCPLLSVLLLKDSKVFFGEIVCTSIMASINFVNNKLNSQLQKTHKKILNTYHPVSKLKAKLVKIFSLFVICPWTPLFVSRYSKVTKYIMIWIELELDIWNKLLCFLKIHGCKTQ